MTKFKLLLLTLLLISGCETLNDAVVRQWHKDSGLSRRTKNQIREGLEKRDVKPPTAGPTRPAPAFIDVG